MDGDCVGSGHEDHAWQKVLEVLEVKISSWTLLLWGQRGGDHPWEKVLEEAK